MGYIKHNAVIVTNSNIESLRAAQQKAKEIFSAIPTIFRNDCAQLVSDIVYGIANGQASFFIAPDGSKEGWDSSTVCHDARQEFMNWLLPNNNFSDYIEVRFGGDDEYETIERSKDKDLDAEN